MVPKVSLRLKDGWMTTWDDGCPSPGYIERRDERWDVETIKLLGVEDVEVTKLSKRILIP